MSAVAGRLAVSGGLPDQDAVPTDKMRLLLVRRTDSRSESGQTNAMSQPEGRAKRVNRITDTRFFSRELDRLRLYFQRVTGASVAQYASPCRTVHS